VTDEMILNMQQTLAGEGIWVEPASAAGLAGLANRLMEKKINLKGKRVVAVCTGHGLKDPNIITDRMEPPPLLPAKLSALEETLLSSGFNQS